MQNLAPLLTHLTKTEHGFKHIISAGDDLLKDENPHVIRGVIEGLKIWTSRPYFKETRRSPSSY